MIDRFEDVALSPCYQSRIGSPPGHPGWGWQSTIFVTMQSSGDSKGPTIPSNYHHPPVFLPSNYHQIIIIGHNSGMFREKLHEKTANSLKLNAKAVSYCGVGTNHPLFAVRSCLAVMGSPSFKKTQSAISQLIQHFGPSFVFIIRFGFANNKVSSNHPASSLIDSFQVNGGDICL
jgi:hypothetical protein